METLADRPHGFVGVGSARLGWRRGGRADWSHRRKSPRRDACHSRTPRAGAQRRPRRHVCGARHCGRRDQRSLPCMAKFAADAEPGLARLIQREPPMNLLHPMILRVTAAILGFTLSISFAVFTDADS